MNKMKQRSHSVEKAQKHKTLENIKQKAEKAKIMLSQLIDKLDSSTSARSTFILVLLFYFLGKSLNYFLYFTLVLYIYLITYRFLRFSFQKSLMYLLDFIYVGNLLLIVFLLFSRENLNYFLSVFSCSSGVIALTIIVDKNEFDLGDGDFITSTFFDSIPILITWAIRWKHYIYREVDSDFVLKVGNVPMQLDSTLLKIIFLPFGIWFLWAIGYLTLNGKILRKFAYSNLYESTICKFYHNKTFSFLLGDHKKLTILKYLIIQFMLLVFSIPIVLCCFYDFYFSVTYLIFIILFLGFNAARNKEKRLKELVKKAEAQEYRRKYV